MVKSILSAPRNHPIDKSEHKNSRTSSQTDDSERGGYRRGKESQKKTKTRDMFAIP